MPLNIDDIHVSYGDHHVLRGVTTRPLKEGTVTGLLGPNAAGKSTLVKTIAGLNDAKSGSSEFYRCDDTAPLRGKELRDAVGYVPQDLLTSASLTAFESILVSTRRSHSLRVVDHSLSMAADVMERLGISRLADSYVGELSGGQRQLVAVAQMLVREPEILLLDEPTSALDLRHQVELLQLVRQEVSDGRSLAMVALHDLNLAARYCDELVVLNGGVVRAQGTPAEVLTPDILQEVYGLRARVLNDAGVPVVCPVAEFAMSRRREAARDEYAVN